MNIDLKASIQSYVKFDGDFKHGTQTETMDKQMLWLLP